ncbi:MAG: alpha/beta fold hydrolase [Verrucomicrobiota bacterium]
MSSFLLVHGGSHGAWCWDPVIACLTRSGHHAWAFDLPGHGRDATPRNHLTIASYADAISAQIAGHQDHDLVVVGHSLAGIALAQGISPHVERVTHAVYLAAIILQPGERAIDRVPEDRRPIYFDLAAQSTDNTIRLPYEMARPTFFSDLPEDQARLYYDSLTPQALSVYLDTATVDASTLDVANHSIVCRNDQALGYRPTLEYANQLGGTITEIDAGHDVMLSRPDVLARTLGELIS